MKPAIQANLEAEQSVLGAILVKPTVLDEVELILEPRYFYQERHRLIYQAIIDLHEKGNPVDLVSVGMLLKDRGKLDQVGGHVFIAALSEAVGFAANAPYYAKKVRDKFRVRELSDRAQKIQELCLRANGNINDVLLQSESLVFEVTSDFDFEDPLVIPASLLLNKDFSKETEIIGNGILPQGGGMILAGESGEGKSLLRLELAVHLALGWDLWNLDIPQPRKVLTIQFENPESLEAYRLKRMLLGLNSKDSLSNLMFSTPTTRFDLGEKKDQARLVKIIEKCGAEVVIYDPLTSLHSVNENDNVMIRGILDNLTMINRKTGAAAVLVHHYGKPGPDSAASHRTRGASAIKDWADTLIGVSRKKGEAILRTLDFLKVRCGPEPRSVTLERSKENFLHTPMSDEDICSPERVRAILEQLGGRVESQEKLLQAIIQATDCNIRRARHFITQAVSRGSICCEEHPTDSRKLSYCT